MKSISPARPLALAALVVLVSSLPSAAAPAQAPLRVCADPNNLPFSDSNGAGFENELARMLAAELGRRLEYTWWPQRRGAIRQTLKAGRCDVILGVPSSLGMVATTQPYYHSSYVFVSKASRGLDLASFDDARLRQLEIGVQVIGDDYANTPPVHALSRRGISKNVRGYSVLGDYTERPPTAAIIRAVQQGEVDVAIAWGPLAGFFAKKSPEPLRITPTPAQDGPLPMRFDISMGVRRDDAELKSRLNGFIERRRARIRALLDRSGVPQP